MAIGFDPTKLFSAFFNWKPFGEDSESETRSSRTSSSSSCGTQGQKVGRIGTGGVEIETVGDSFTPASGSFKATTIGRIGTGGVEIETVGDGDSSSCRREVEQKRNEAISV